MPGSDLGSQYSDIPRRIDADFEHASMNFQNRDRDVLTDLQLLALLAAEYEHDISLRERYDWRIESPQSVADVLLEKQNRCQEKT